MYVDSCSSFGLSDLLSYWIETQIQRGRPAPSDAKPVIDVEFTPVSPTTDSHSDSLMSGERHVPCLAPPRPDGLIYGRASRIARSPHLIRPSEPRGQLIDIVA